MADEQDEKKACDALRARNERKSLIEMVADVREVALNLRRYMHPQFGHALLAPKSVLLQHQALLDQQGIHTLGYLGHGSLAVVLTTGQGTVVRLAPVGEALRPTLPEYLQPIFSADKSGLRLEVLPEVQMEGVTRQHIGRLALALLEKGYRFNDHPFGNVGLLSDGTPVVVDADATGKIPAFVMKTAKPFLQKMIRLQYGLGKDEPTYDYEAAQKAHIAAMVPTAKPAPEDREAPTDDGLSSTKKWRGQEHDRRKDDGQDGVGSSVPPRK